MIGLVGGIGGVLLGMGVSGIINIMAGSGGPQKGMASMFGTTSVSIELMIFAFLFSLIIGMIAGTIPAYKASRLKPVDALRYQ
jgi:putative ABC transport system permease protein